MGFSDHQDILFGITGQTLHLDVPEGQPSSVTSATVFEWQTGDDGTSEDATTGTASVDSVDTTVDAASGRSQSNPRQLNLTSTSNIEVGRLYLLTGSNGEKEWVEPTEIATNDYIIVRHPLAHDYVATNTFEGTRISIDVDSTWVADKNNISYALETAPGYRVRWVYVVGGTTYVRYTTFDLSRYAGKHNVTPQDIDMLVPGWIRVLPNEYQSDSGRALIDSAYQQVTVDLLQEGVNDEQARHQDVIDELTKRKAVVLWADARLLVGGGDPISVELAKLRYDERLNQFVRGPSQVKFPVSTDETGAGSRVAPTAITVR